MASGIGLWLSNVAAAVQGFYTYIFPEYPVAGVGVIFLTVLLFLIYLLKSSLKHALKVSMLVGFALTFTLFAVHELSRILHISF